MKNNKTFTKDDLQIGFVVKLRNGQFRMVFPVEKNGTPILTAGRGLADGWDYLNCWGHNLDALRLARDMDIVAVYGHVSGTENYHEVGAIDSKNRQLLWIREEPKKMTLSEVCEELGYRVELVPEE